MKFFNQGDIKIMVNCNTKSCYYNISGICNADCVSMSNKKCQTYKSRKIVYPVYIVYRDNRCFCASGPDEVFEKLKSGEIEGYNTIAEARKRPFI